jgi:hypothetical protein
MNTRSTDVTSGTSSWPVLVLSKSDMLLQPMDNEGTTVAPSPLKRTKRDHRATR